MHDSIDKLAFFSTLSLYVLFYFLNYISFGIYIMAALSFLILYLSFLKRGSSKRGFVIVVPHGYFFLFLLLFSAFCFLSSVWAWDKTYSIEKGVTFLELFVCMYCVYSYYSKVEKTDSLLSIVMYGGYVISVLVLLTNGIGVIVSGIISSERVGSTFANTNSVAITLSISVLINFYYFLNGKYRKWLLFDILAVILVAAGGSRTALVLLIVGVFLIFSMNSFDNKHKVKSIIKSLFLMTIIVVILYLVSLLPLFNGIKQRMEGLISMFLKTENADSSSLLRRQYMDIGMNAFKNNFLLGIGMGNSIVLTSINTTHSTYLHNNYVELLASGGVTGFVLYYSIYIFVFCILLKKRKVLGKAALLSATLLIVLLITDYGTVSYYSKGLYFILLSIILYINLSEPKYENN